MAVRLLLPLSAQVLPSYALKVVIISCDIPMVAQRGPPNTATAIARDVWLRGEVARGEAPRGSRGSAIAQRGMSSVNSRLWNF